MNRRVAIVTGTRAEFGLLRPVMDAVARHPDLDLLVVAAGAHLLEPEHTIDEVRAAYDVAEVVAMQQPGPTSRAADAEALGRGVGGFARAWHTLAPHWVVVLGDRIEAFAAAAAASVSGIAVAHIHGGDRAEGVADEAMRHAITKLAHLHLPATRESAERIVRMGEAESSVHVVGSPAIDALAGIEPASDEQTRDLGCPQIALLLHPVGRSPAEERATAERVLAALHDWRIVAIHPNHDPGREGILAAIEDAAADSDRIRVCGHLSRERFVGLLRRLAQDSAEDEGGALVGNSSAGLIEAAALKLPAVDVGRRQAGRHRPVNVIHCEETGVGEALAAALSMDRSGITHPYGDGCTGRRIADLLATVDPRDPDLVRKRCAY